MKAALFVEPGRMVLEDAPVPDPGPLAAVVRITTTTTDMRISKGGHPAARGLTVGREPVAVSEKLGAAVAGYRQGRRASAAAITPSGRSAAPSCGGGAQDGAGTPDGRKASGGRRFGGAIDGCRAELVLLPDAVASMAPVPDELTDEPVTMGPDIVATSLGGAASGGIRIGGKGGLLARAAAWRHALGHGRARRRPAAAARAARGGAGLPRDPGDAPPRRQGADASLDDAGRSRSWRSGAVRRPSPPAGPKGGGSRARPWARWRVEGRDHALTHDRRVR